MPPFFGLVTIPFFRESHLTNLLAYPEVLVLLWEAERTYNELLFIKGLSCQQINNLCHA